MADCPIKAAAKAHTDLNVFASVVSILEGGHVYTATGRAEADAIIRRCKAVQQRLLREYDRNVKAAGGTIP